MLERLRTKRFSAFELIGFGSTAAWMAAAAAWAVTIPHTFTDAASITPARLNANFQALKASVDVLEGKLQHVQVVQGAINGLAGPHLIFTGANVHVRSGAGSTDEGDCNGAGAACSGLGNLLVGYNEPDPAAAFGRTGSHNLVVGRRHEYSSYGGFVAGYRNDVTAQDGSVSGGAFNTASGKAASVSGGYVGYATGNYSSVSGGFDNVASASYGSVSGGAENDATGTYASVSGGFRNEASGVRSSVSGGSTNDATGSTASVSGGYVNEARGSSASVSGGTSNVSTATYSSVSGGNNRSATGVSDWAAGSLSEDF